MVEDTPKKPAKKKPAKKKPVKPGIATSEFWLAFLATLLCGLSVAYATQPWAQAVGVVGCTLSTMGYGFARSIAKRDANK